MNNLWNYFNTPANEKTQIDTTKQRESTRIRIDRPTIIKWYLNIFHI